MHVLDDGLWASAHDTLSCSLWLIPISRRSHISCITHPLSCLSFFLFQFYYSQVHLSFPLLAS
ncbi:uncharacterized protein LACBIDRAFT_318906 [Laccaria bicolor S238N-H82]|uniref:Predicted protein n=1 Tax=Laccaria bicolor (strain S238N-H82 / ATCC MYA-4686) TaxID=486041 RepID=B0D7E2_LACBS|nr:uncharacterized protein LACBIDRAFT_318906 [Laccaria bicolor S238N-H82]EDR09638.1 predicted protein [Laccaria bicolor S238N-H82]|eukprot:XP_001879987.1 predicted protein [Laccaria bicolor S238N-H82]